MPAHSGLVHPGSSVVPPVIGSVGKTSQRQPCHHGRRQVLPRHAILLSATWCGCPNLSFRAPMVSEYGVGEWRYAAATRRASSSLR